MSKRTRRRFLKDCGLSLGALSTAMAGRDRHPRRTPGPGDFRSEFDVVVYGGSSAGVTAAVQASRMGCATVLVSPEQHLGGLTSSGLGWTDTGDQSPSAA